MSNPLGDMGSLLRQAQEMQRALDRVREDLRRAVVHGSAGGGLIKVELSGDRRIQRVHIDPEVLKTTDVRLLEDLVLSAVRDALTQAESLAESSMSRVTGGMQLPGMF